MRKSWMGLGAALLWAIAGSAAAELKIGYVNAAALLQGSPQAEAVQQRLRGEFAPKRRELEAKQAKIKQMEDELGKNGLMLSEEQRKKRERDIIEARRDIKYTSDQFEDDLRLRQAEEVGKLREQLLTAVESFAKKEGYDLILYEGVIYAAEAVDVTDRVLQVLKAGAGGG
jgi:outer membrane protein